MVCTFFGHRDILEDIKPALTQTITDLIKNNSVDTFYVDDKGDFDNIVRKTLKELAEKQGKTIINIYKR